MKKEDRARIVDLLDTLSGESMNYQTAASRNSDTEHYSRRMGNCKDQILEYFDKLREEKKSLKDALTNIGEKSKKLIKELDENI